MIRAATKSCGRGRSKLQERKAVYEKLLQLDAEIEGLRSAQTAIDKLAVMKQALRK